MVLLTGALAGCNGSSSPRDFRGLDRAEAYASGGRTISADGAPPASVDGAPVEWEELRDRLAEAAGATVLEEIALERQLDREMRRRGIAVGEGEIAAERRLLLETVSREAPGENTEQLVTILRARRGLGPARYEAMLRRNAMLRALVQDRVELTPEQLERAWRVRHGERVRIRIIVTQTEREAAAARQAALAGEPALLESRFMSLAEQVSTDASAARGGLIETFSADDPAYESAVRLAVADLQPGGVSPVVAVRNGFSVIYLDERLAPDGVSFATAEPALRAELRLRQERLLMDELAAQLLSEARITTFNDALGWSRQAGTER